MPLPGAFLVVGAAAGFWSNCPAFISDAGCNLADAPPPLSCWYAVRAARRPADAKRTSGCHGAGILAALVNAVCLVLVGFAAPNQRPWLDLPRRRDRRAGHPGRPRPAVAAR
jgi:Co/Zn/Cd efflux system component